jgi:hypothetical protein
MNINDAFPSKYLKAADIPEGNPVVTIRVVTTEEVGRDKEERPVLYFEGEEKGIILNKTNATNISKLYGYETEDWPGRQVALGVAMVDFQGQSVEAIRIYPPRRQSPNAPLKAVQKQAPANGQNAYAKATGVDERNPPPRELDDDIPF